MLSAGVPAAWCRVPSASVRGCDAIRRKHGVPTHRATTNSVVVVVAVIAVVVVVVVVVAVD